MRTLESVDPTVRLFSQETGMTQRPKRALEDSVADPDRLHQRLFFALCRDLTDFAAFENSVEATTIYDLVSDYATGEWQARKPDHIEAHKPDHIED